MFMFHKTSQSIFMNMTVRLCSLGMAYLLVLTLFATTTYAQKKGVLRDITSDKSAPERKPILNALRPIAEKDLKQKVKIRVSSLTLMNGFACLEGEFRTEDGEEIDYRKTIHDYERDGNSFQALLQLKKGKWVYLDYSVGCTYPNCDTEWEWPKTYGVPRKLLVPAGE